MSLLRVNVGLLPFRLIFSQIKERHGLFDQTMLGLLIMDTYLAYQNPSLLTILLLPWIGSTQLSQSLSSNPVAECVYFDHVKNYPPQHYL